MQTALPLNFLTHIFECVSLQGFHCVVLPGIILAVGTVTGQADLHGWSLAANVTDHFLFSAVKHTNKVQLLITTKSDNAMCAITMYAATFLLKVCSCCEKKCRLLKFQNQELQFTINFLLFFFQKCIFYFYNNFISCEVMYFILFYDTFNFKFFS